MTNRGGEGAVSDHSASNLTLRCGTYDTRTARGLGEIWTTNSPRSATWGFVVERMTGVRCCPLFAAPKSADGHRAATRARCGRCRRAADALRSAGAGGRVAALAGASVPYACSQASDRPAGCDQCGQHAYGIAQGAGAVSNHVAGARVDRVCVGPGSGSRFTGSFTPQPCPGLPRQCAVSPRTVLMCRQLSVNKAKLAAGQHG